MKSPNAWRALALVGTLALAGNAVAETAPPQITEKLTTAPEHPYDETADAHSAVDVAIARAAATHKFVMLEFGGNWCPDCRVTAGVLAMNGVDDWIDKNFVVVPIDVGRMTKNLDIARGYGVKITAVPTLIVVDQQGHMVNSGNPAALQDARGMSPQAIVDTIYDWIKKAA